MTTGDSFAKMYQSVILDKRLTDRDFRILAFILSHANWRTIQTYISENMGISQSTVTRSIRRLDAAGYLTFETKQTQRGPQRRNVRMTHRPSHWESESAGKEFSETKRTAESVLVSDMVKADIATSSKMTIEVVKSDELSRSDLTTYEEKTKISNPVLDTKSGDKEVDETGLSEVSRALWKRFNTPPEGYFPIDPEGLNGEDQDLLAQMLRHARDTLAGLQMKPGTKTEFSTDVVFYTQQVEQELGLRALSTFLRPKFFVQLAGSQAFVYAPLNDWG